MPGVADGLETDLGVTPVRRWIAQIGVEADDGRKGEVGRGSGDGSPISVPTLMGWGIDGSNGCCIAQPAGNRSNRHRLIVHGPFSTSDEFGLNG
jgi:hypothetical protein